MAKGKPPHPWPPTTTFNPTTTAQCDMALLRWAHRPIPLQPAAPRVDAMNGIIGEHTLGRDVQLAREDVAHLLRRSGFGGFASEIDALTGLDLPQVVDRVLDTTGAPSVV